MSTNTIIAIVVVVVLVLGGGYYFMNGGYSMSSDRAGASDVAGGAESSATPTSNDSGESFTGSISTLAARGGSYTCAVQNAGALSEGTVYVSGTNMRGDFTSTVNNSPMTSHMIRSGTTMYIWSSASPQGVKMAVSPGTPATTPSGASVGQGVDQSASYSWHCSMWTPDQSQFAPPSSTTFIDTAAMMGGSKMPAPGTAGY